ncbi:MAG: HigA family addiction module antidote protein [Planctomycetes bacterium]|nr:HigA family addiction module antidote protein [Planctomycetota bacterium]
MLPHNRISTHPGEILLEEFLKPLGLSQSELARNIGVRPGVINEICKQRRAVSPRMAVLLGTAFKNSPEFWSGLQADHDLSKAIQDKDCREAAKLVRTVV